MCFNPDRRINAAKFVENESGIKEREDYEEEAFNIFRFYVGPIECETPSL